MYFFLAAKLGLVPQRCRCWIKLNISDNGVGFNVYPDLTNSTDNCHLGLMGMRERAELLNGDLQVQSNPGKGTSIKVSVPVSEAVS